MTLELSRRRVLFGVTVSSSARAFLDGQLCHLAYQGWDVHLVCGEAGLEDFARKQRVSKLHVIPAKRKPSIRDVGTLFALWLMFRRVKPDVVILGTPKIGMLGSIAAAGSQVRSRIYLVHGYRAEGFSGGKRRFMRIMERLACMAATDVVAVSPSLAATLIGDGIVPSAKIRVLGSGSANGVDVDRFRPASASERREARLDVEIPATAPVVAYVGRLTRDKGLPSLPLIWSLIAAEHHEAWLLIAGEPEPVDDDDRDALVALTTLPRVRVVGHSAAVERIYQASNVLLLLSKREGLGMVALEAAACGVPTVGYDVTGVRDAVVPEETGILVVDGDATGAAKAVSEILGDTARAHQLGQTGARRVKQEFAQERVWQEWGAYLQGKSEMSAWLRAKR